MSQQSNARRKGPGRPEGQTRLREDILDAAEIFFADTGYAGTSLRHVASEVGVTTALITYYFGSKEKLFREVFIRKGQQIATERMEALEQLQKETGSPTTTDLVRAFLAPPLKLRATRQGRAFLRLHSRLHMEPEALSFELRRQVYDESTRAYAQAFQKALPHLSEGLVMRRMSLIIGSYLYAFSDTNRMDELAPATQSTYNIFYDLEEIVVFAASGMQAPAVTERP